MTLLSGSGFKPGEKSRGVGGLHTGKLLHSENSSTLAWPAKVVCGISFPGRLSKRDA